MTVTAEKITWFRYARHEGSEREVGPLDTHLPGHHGDYSFLQQIEAPMTNATTELLAKRGETHGSFADNARIAQATKNLWRGQKGWASLTDIQREALEVISLKVSRIISGKPEEPDHWCDISGYATLAIPQEPKEECTGYVNEFGLRYKQKPE